MNPEILESMRREARDIFYEGLAAVDPETCIHRCCSIQGPVLKIENKTYDLDRFTKILVLGAGKAGASMARAVEALLKDRITAGLVIVKYGHVRPQPYYPGRGRPPGARRKRPAGR